MKVSAGRVSLVCVLIAAELGSIGCSRTPAAPTSPTPSPPPARVHTTLTGSLCTRVTLLPWMTCTEPFERSHAIDVSRPGTMTLNVDYRYVGDYYPNSLSLDVHCGESVIVRRDFVKQGDYPARMTLGGTTGPFDVSLPQACRYEIRLFDFVADTKGGHQTTYQVEAEYPQ